MQPIEAAVQHHQAGRLLEAERIYHEILLDNPEDARAMHFLGVLELQRGSAERAVTLISRALVQSPGDAQALNHLGEAYRALNQLDAASDCYRRAILINPSHADAYSNLGIVLQAQEQLAQAIRCFRTASELKPKWGGAYFNLGLALKRNGDLGAASEAFGTGWLRDPAFLDSAGQCVATLADLAKTTTVPLAATQPSVQPFKFISAVFCSIDDVKCARTLALYDRLLEAVPHEIIAIRDARSLAEAYNRAIQKCQGDIIVLSHDDIDILAPDFAARLEEHLQEFDVIGVVGGTTMHGPAWKCSGHPHLRGWITHRVTHSGTYLVGVLHPRAVGRDIMTLDGVFVAARREVFSAIDFDEATFDGFHLYDIDWSYRAAQAGFRVGTAGDLLVVHESRGDFGVTLGEYANRFCQKHQVEPKMAGPTMIFEAEMGSSSEVRQFFARLDKMTGALSDV